MTQKTRMTMGRSTPFATLTIALTAAIAPPASARVRSVWLQAGEMHAHANAALRHGILILLVPTLVLFFLIAGLVYRRRNVSR